MFPILLGIAAGIVGYSTVRWLARLITGWPPEAFAPLRRDPRNEHLRLLLWSLAWAVLIVALVVVVPAMLALDGISEHRDWLRVLAQQTTAGSFVLGLLCGVLGARWYREAGEYNGENVALRGAAVGLLTLAVLFLGLDRELHIFGRLSKFSTSIVSIELDRPQGGEAPPIGANAPGAAPPAWAAEQSIGFAYVVAADLADKALERDRQVIALVSKEAEPALEKSKALLRDHIKGLAEERRQVHTARRNGSPAFFDTEGLEAIRLAMSLRDLVVADLRGTSGLDESRDTRLDKVAAAYGDYYASTQRSLCLFVRPFAVSELEEKEAALTAEIVKAGDLSAHILQNKLIERASLQMTIGGLRWNQTVECRLVSDRDAFAARSNSQAVAFRKDVPSRDIVRQLPYVAILSASLLLGAGEREAAVAVLELWWRAAAARVNVEEVNADIARTAAKDEVAEKAAREMQLAAQKKKVLEKVFIVRVVNLIGLLLSNRSNPGHLEMNWHYQRLALDDSDFVIEGVISLKTYASKHKFPEPEKFDMLSGAGRPSSDLRNRCEDFGKLAEGPRYFVFRRAILLNNVVYFLSVQRDLLEQPGMRERFDDLIEELRGLRFECLAVGTGIAKDKVRAEFLSGILETVAQGLKTQASLRQGDAKGVRQSLCDGYRAALFAQRLAASVGDGVLTRQDILDRSFDSNLEKIAEFATARSTRTLVREFRQRLEALGEGACVL